MPRPHSGRQHRQQHGKRPCASSVVGVFVVVVLFAVAMVFQSGRMLRPMAEEMAMASDDVLPAAASWLGVDDAHTHNNHNHNHTHNKHTHNLFPAFLTSGRDARPFPDHRPDHNCDATNTKRPIVHAIDDHPKSYNWSYFLKPLHGQLPSSSPSSSPSSLSLQNSTNTNIDTAVCAVLYVENMPHFPHAMQRLLSCWSFWNHFPGSAKVLFVSPGWNASKTFKSSFNNATYAMLSQAQNVTIVQGDDVHQYIATTATASTSTPTSRTVVVERVRPQNFEVRRMEDVATFKRAVMDWVGIGIGVGMQDHQVRSCLVRHHVAVNVENVGGGIHDKRKDGGRLVQRHSTSLSSPSPLSSTPPPPPPPPPPTQLLPRIAILNRSSRKLLDATNISIAIQRHFDLPYSPPIFYFEKLPFERQVEAMASVDILVSPHGAQLTSIIFMPKCGSLIEILAHGYGRNRFFGSLASISGLGHSYIYLGTNMTAETKQHAKTYRGRLRARSKDLCVPIWGILDTIHSELIRWELCCQAE